MKKTVSINIGGIIFHIEEDGYDRLKGYLDSVNEYFSSFEDSKEIIADIEGRIAEIFLTKLSLSRQTLNTEDVEELIATMGTTRDFDDTLEAEPEVSGARTETENQDTAGPRTTGKAKRLYRDVKRKIIGGVASGIAHYFGIDPLWIRLLFIAFFVNVFFGGVTGAAVLAYIILWIVIPSNDELEDDTRVKKLFRNPDERVLGGVSGGIAAYFGVDVAIIRLLFVLSIFLGGAGVLIYIILWIITPEAKTITEKMQMEGEPVTITNIEETVKRKLRVKEGEEGPLVKVLLFPFRLIALLIDTISRLLGPLMRFLVDAIRIIFGAFLATGGFIFMMGFIFSLLTFYGVSGFTSLLELGEFPVELVRNSVDPLVVVSIFIFFMITSLAFFLLGLAIILKRKIINSYVGWSLLAVWIIALAVASTRVPAYIVEFKSRNNHKTETTFNPVAGVPTLRLSKDIFYDHNLVELRLRGHEDTVFQLTVDVESRGASRAEAEENARAVTYEVIRNGADFEFDPGLKFEDNAKYRVQQATATFYIPYGTVFRMERELSRILVNTLHLNGYKANQMQNNDWIFDADGIRCITCKTDESTPADKPSGSGGGEEMVYPFEGFSEMKVASFFTVDIRKGDDYRVMVRGDEDDLEEVYLNQVGDVLEVRFKDKNWKWWKDNYNRDVDLIVVMPELTYLEMVGACKGEASGFDNEDIEIDLIGASELLLRTKAKDVSVSLTGASSLTLMGSGDDLEAKIIGASRLHAFDYSARRVSLDVVGASTAHVNASEDLDVNAAGMSTVRYRGDASVSSNEAGMSSIQRD